jgi:hypothetical protein
LTIDVSGVTAPNAILSINGELALVGPDGAFKVKVNLTPGPNLIEVIATDLSGGAKYAPITVVYVP